MSPLEEILPALSASVPEISGQLSAVIAESDTVQRAAQDLLQDVQQKRAQAAQLLAQIQGALGEIEQQSAAQQVDLETGMKEAEGALGTALDGIRDAQDELTAVADTVDTARTDLQGELAQAGADTTAAEKEIHDALGELGSSLETGQQELGTALEAARTEAESLQGVLENARTDLAEVVSGLRQRMQDFLAQARQQVTDAAGVVRTRHSEHDSHLGGEMTRLSAGREEMLREAGSRVETEARQAVAEAIGGVMEALHQLEQAVAGSLSELDTGRQSVEGSFDVLREAMQPLPGGVESVKVAADQMGLSWA